MSQSQGTVVFRPSQAQEVANIATLRAQLRELNIEARALRATSPGLKRRLDGMRLDNSARPVLRQQSADIDAQLARVEGRIAEVQARVAQDEVVSLDRVSGTAMIAMPPQFGGFRRGPDPDMVVGMSFALATCIALPLSISYARRLWKGDPPQTSSPDRFDDVVERLDRLEHGVDSIAIEVERISEGQRFVTKALASGPAEQPPGDAK